MEGNNNPPPAPPKRKFKAQVVFDNGQGANIDVESFDHIGALCGITANLANMPLRVMKLQFWDATDQRIISVLPTPRIPG